jgi:hypothetical protein
MVPLLVKAPSACRPAMAATWSAPELTKAWPPPPLISTETPAALITPVPDVTRVPPSMMAS